MQRHSLSDILVSKLHERSDGGRSSVELGNLVLVYHSPESARIRVEWGPFKLKTRQNEEFLVQFSRERIKSSLQTYNDT